MFGDSIKRGTIYLTTQQQDGGFKSFSSTNIQNFTNTRIYSSTFSTSLILSCLNQLQETQLLKKVKSQIAEFLLSQKSSHWSYNYWVRNSKQAREMPCPDDLDATFCALSSLYQFNQQLIHGEAMAKIVQLLVATEIQEGGPYRTWLVAKNTSKVWRDIDPAVNSNIAYFLSLQDITLPNLNLFIERCIDTENYTSPYYPTVYPVIYFISRFYKGRKTKKIIDYLLSKKLQDKSWGNSLNTALAISALLNLGVSDEVVDDSIYQLVGKEKDGFWEAYGFCIDPARHGKIYYSGSSALTTAFCIAAISQYMDFRKIKNISESHFKTSKHEILYKFVVRKVKQNFSKLNKDLRIESVYQMENIIQKDREKQIVLLPYFFASAITKRGKNIDKEMILNLCAANLYGWIAYTIYDNFLDEEATPSTLPVATFSLRKLTTIFINILPPKNQFQEIFQTVMNDLDSANTWEVKNCRIKIVQGKLHIKDFKIPDFGNKKQLALKSLGHALGPIAILFSLGYTKNSKEVKNLIAFFINYLIARQLNDDAHDWEQDLRRGQVNVIGALLLKKARIASKEEVSLTELIPKLQKLFWYKVLPEVSAEILIYTKKARSRLKKLTIIKDPTNFEKMLSTVEYAANEALKEHKNAVMFIKAY